MSSATLIDVPMPQMGVAVTEGTVVAWRVAAGDAVVADQPVCDIATDKVDTEVVAPADGVVAELVAAEGETVAIGAPLARIATGEAAGAVPAAATGTPRQDEPASAPTALPELQPPAAAGEPAGAPHCSDALAGAVIDTAAAADAPLARGGRSVPLASPVARRLARELGVDLAAVQGSGRRGRVCKRDVLAAAERGAAVEATTPIAPTIAAPAPAVGGPTGRDGAGAELPAGYEDVPHELAATSHIRRTISEHMIRSRQTAAHMTTEVDVDMHRVTGVRRELNAEREAAGRRRVSFLSFIARAAVAALAEFPDLNATFQHERVIRWREVNLGVAVDTESGLLVPVIRGAERLTVEAIAEAIADLGERARTRRLVPDDLRAGTFTISNPGSVGAVSAPAIINQPQVAILGTPTIVKRPWVVTTDEGTDVIVPRPIMRLALTFDHRAIDGADATRYVVRVKEHLERWDARAYR